MTAQSPKPPAVASEYVLGLQEQSVRSMSYDGSEMAEIEGYLSYEDNGLGEDWDPDAKLEPLVPLKYTEFSAPSTSLGDSALSGLDHEEQGDALERFFTSFIDLELEGEVNLCSWVSSLSELCPRFTEKELYSLFLHIDSERTGFIDVVDFVQFCDGGDAEDDDEIAGWRIELISAIESHPSF